MIAALHPLPGNKTAKVQVAFLAAAYLFIWSLVLYSYLPFTALSFLLGAMALPFTITKSNGKVRYRYAMIALAWIAASFFIPVKTFLYFSIGFSVFFLIESAGYRLGYVSCSILVFMSPLFQHFSNVFSFPIRLQLTKWAGKIFTLLNAAVVTKGNVIYNNSAEFSVDPACMGLNMLTASVLLSSMLLGYYQKKYGTQVKAALFFSFISLVVVLNIISNLIRIVVLVHFIILPGTILHEVIGIGCLMVYVVLPSALLAKFISYRSINAQPIARNVSDTDMYRPLLHYLLLGLVLLAAHRTHHTDTFKKFENRSHAKIPGFTVTSHSPGIVKLENDTALIYVKYIRGFYDTEHNPTICWSGSGYEFQQVKETTVNNHTIYTALLTNGKEQLTTAWWYSNGSQHLTGQVAWRWSMAKGEKGYALINVTTANPKDREEVITKIISAGLFTPLF